MKTTISKSTFKPKALEYLRLVETKKQPLTITHFGKPVVTIIPHKTEAASSASQLKGSVVSYQDPFYPVVESWNAQK